MEETGEEYQIVPHMRIKELEKQVRNLKSDPLGASAEGSAMKESMDNLSKSMSGMVNLFKDASDSMKLEEKESDIIAQRIEPMAEKIDTLIEQNKKIAKGILAVADMVQEFMDKAKEEERHKHDELPRGPPPPRMEPNPSPRPMSFNPQPVPPGGIIPPPMPSAPGPMPPPGMAPHGPATIPPPPGGPTPAKKKGLFG